jgi:hypothetical protein
MQRAALPRYAVHSGWRHALLMFADIFKACCCSESLWLQHLTHIIGRHCSRAATVRCMAPRRKLAGGARAIWRGAPQYRVEAAASHFVDVVSLTSLLDVGGPVGAPQLGATLLALWPARRRCQPGRLLAKRYNILVHNVCCSVCSCTVSSLTDLVFINVRCHVAPDDSSALHGEF